MLINLTSKSIAEFGTVCSGGLNEAMSRLGRTLIKNRSVDKTSFRSLYIHDSEKTIIDRTDGTAILFCGRTPNELHTFLLDKTVIINPGIYYHVLPLLGKAQIAVSAASGTRLEIIGIQEKPGSILPLIEPSEIFTLLYHEKERGFSFKGEQHDFWELTYVERGELHNVVDGTDYVQHQGEVMLFLPNQFHSQYAERDHRVFYTTVGFAMHFQNPDFFCGRIFSADRITRELCRRMFEERDFGRIYSNDLILCYLKEIIIQLLRTQQVENVVQTIPKESRPVIENTIISAAEDYVKNHLEKRITVSEIAKAIPVSETYLSALFKRNTGESLNHYINSQKMNLAKEYIISGRYTFTQIAQMLGYNSVHYFSQSFKRYLGLTPSDYANLHKGETVEWVTDSFLKKKKRNK